MKKSSSSASTKRKATSVEPAQGNKRFRPPNLGPMDDVDKARGSALATLSKTPLLGSYTFLHQAKLVDPHAPSPEEMGAPGAWNSELIGRLCALSETDSPSLEDVRAGVFVPPPADVPLSPIIVRSAPRATTPSKPARPVIVHDSDGGGSNEETPAARLRSLEDKLSLERAKSASLEARLQEVQDASSLAGLLSKGPLPSSHAHLTLDKGPSVPGDPLAKVTLLPPHLSSVWLGLRPTTRTSFYEGNFIPLALFRHKSFVQSLGSGSKMALETNADGSVKCVASGKHTPLTDDEFLPTLRVLHQLDVYLRQSRILYNSSDLILVERVVEATSLSVAYNWYEEASYLAHQGRTYTGLKEPTAEQWTRWLTTKALQPSPRAYTPAPAEKGNKPSGGRKADDVIPLELRRKAKVENICMKFNRGTCLEPASHNAVLFPTGQSGQKVSTFLSHLCLSCNDASHSWHSCPRRK